MLGTIISGIIVTVLMIVLAILALGPAYLEARQWRHTSVDRTQKSLLVTFLVLFVVLCTLSAAVYFASGERSGGRHAIQSPEAVTSEPEPSTALWWQGSVPSGRPVLGAWKVGGTYVCRVVFCDDLGNVYEYWGDGMKAWAVETDPMWWTELPGGPAVTVSASDNTGRNACPLWLRVTATPYKRNPISYGTPKLDARFKRICQDTDKVLEMLKAGKTKRETAKALGMTYSRVYFINARANDLGII